MSESGRPTARRGPGSTEGPADCLFCQRMRAPELLRPRLVLEDDTVHASHQVAESGASYLGAVLLQTKRHVASLGHLTDAEGRALGTAVVRLCRAVEQCTGAPWTYCYSFLEAVQHVHVLIVARYAEMPKEYVRLGAEQWPAAPRGTVQEVAELCQRLRGTV
jgi:diadenosine tetraphosphate (Ap4A) HIT family hydrolase